MDARAFLPEGVPRGLVGLLPGRRTPTTRCRRSWRSAARCSMGAEDTPYGRLATAADPTGASFKLIG